ncbi:NEL-type E3 ubiquitin ligase domain-containing protein [Pseudomonas sp. RT4P38]
MPDLQGSTSELSADNKGRHYAFIESRIHSTFKNAPLRSVRELALTKTTPAPWIKTATDRDHAHLQNANLELWSSRNKIDHFLDKLQNVYQFAEPLLTDALKKQFGVEVDVRTTYLYLYLPKKNPWYIIDSNDGFVTRTVSLLDAALHNFARNENCEPDSEFISQPDSRGHFAVLPIKRKMSIPGFQNLCRELDIGAHYSQYLEEQLRPKDGVAQYVLQRWITDTEKAAFKAAAQQAVMTGDIDFGARVLILSMLDGQRKLLRNGRAMQFAELYILDSRLTGIVLIAPDLEQHRGVVPVIAYVPQDPEHPLKEYPSTSAFMSELARQLRDNAVISSTGMSYRQYFSRFVDQTQRGHFFGELQQRLFDVKWHYRTALDPLPNWREIPKTAVNLQFSVTPIRGDLYEHLYQAKLNKLLNDAQHIAVSTADTDRNARWAWWDNFKKIVSDIFNVALLVATPFVPGVGELMMVYTAYQITSDVIEGIVDLAEGLRIEAAEHVVGVVTDIIQLALFAAGAKLGEIAKLKLSPLVEGMKPVKLPNGEPRLWHPDLKAYELSRLTLATDSRPDKLGLHAHEGQSILPLDDKHFAVHKDAQTGDYRITHPQRPYAYRPELQHNSLGAWTHEAENPRTWERPTLMRRLGHSVDAFNDTELENSRIVSGIEDGALRKMYIDHTAPPPLLEDSIERLEIQRLIGETIQRIRTGQALDPSSYWFEPMATYLDGWPADKAIKVNADLTGPLRQYGNATATGEQTLSTSLSHILSEQFAQSLVDFLDAPQIEALLGGTFAKPEQVQALRNRLADEAQRRHADVFNYLYQDAQVTADPHVRLIREVFPELPTRAVTTLLSNAEGADLERMAQEHWLPLSIKSRAREAAFEARTNHAYAGFEDAVQWVPETENLILNALRLHSDTFHELRIEVRDASDIGPLRCSVGSQEASTVRVLIRDERGRYEIRDGDNRPLSQAQDFYEAVLQALPADKQAHLGYRPGQGNFLKQWVMAKTDTPVERRTALAEPPIRTHPVFEDMLLLRGPTLSRSATTLTERVEDLYPHFNQRETRTFVRSLGSEEQGHQTLTRLERELDDLKVLLNQWRFQQPEGWGPGSQSFRDKGGLHISDRLIECFQRQATVFGERSITAEGGYALDLSVELLPVSLERWWKKLPNLKPYLDQIDTLNLDRTRFSAKASGLLKDFPHLRQLSARACELKQLPEGIGQMHFLRTLRLIDNQITLTAADVERLKNLTRMETIRLDDNPPLGLLPNVERMPRLKVLCLSNTGATTWPQGVLGLGPFNKPRPRGFFLDLQQNPISEIPNVVPGSHDALIVARTRLYPWDLSDTNKVMFQEYRRSVGLAPEQAYAQGALDAIAQWPMKDDSEWWSKEVSGLGTFREEAWHDLISEPGSEGFFKLIQKQTLGADYRAGGERRDQLSSRVWRMIEAIDLDTGLRKDLFEMATAPTTCADAGAQVFNHMGIKVLVSEAYAFSTSTEDLENSLATLAKGAARLARVEDIARADFASREGNPDEVEVFLAYETGLAQRLGLPWQSESMLFRPIAGVSGKTLDTAFDTVMSMEVGDGLINDMIELPFWEKYLRDTYPNEFTRNIRLYEQKTELLDQLRESQQAWVSAKGGSTAHRQNLKRHLQDLARQLDIADSSVLVDQAMADEVYGQLLNDIGYQEKELSRRLTREALQKSSS